jgi:hypothetical protein
MLIDLEQIYVSETTTPKKKMIKEIKQLCTALGKSGRI